MELFVKQIDLSNRRQVTSGALNMQSTRRQKVQTVHNEPDEFISAGLRNSVLQISFSLLLVLRTLMEHFSKSELLQLSVVSKLWNYEAKSIIRDRGGIFPSFKSGGSTCDELAAFASDLRQMDVVPFTGMNIHVFKSITLDSHDCESTKPSLSGAPLDPPYDVILDRLPLKRLSLHINSNVANQKDCPAILLAKQMLRHFSEVIQELSINVQHRQFIQDYNRHDLSFRRLKTLRITGSPKERHGWERDFVKALVSRAPNLEQLETSGSLRFMDKILEGSSATVVPSGGLDPFDADLPESRFRRLRIEKMVLLATGQRIGVERFCSVIPALLQTYRDTLNTLHIAVKLILPLMYTTRPAICGPCLPNVREFKIYMSVARSEPSPPAVRVLKAFDFTRSLPALTKVVIINKNLSNPYDEIQNFMEQENAVLEELTHNRSVNIKQLCLTDYLSHQTAPLLSETFPNIEILTVMETERSTFLCGQIWNHWIHLKTIDVKISGGLNAGAYDHIESKICGSFPEEVAELREREG